MSSPTPERRIVMNTAIQRDEAVMVREIDGEIVVLDTRANQVHQLNRTASFIWRMCAPGTTPQAMASALAAEFAVDEATALDDVLKTLAQLRSLNLLANDG
ncbi:MAG: PqqD family protein [Burkholderiaceae bacterium]